MAFGYDISRSTFYSIHTLDCKLICMVVNFSCKMSLALLSLLNFSPLYEYIILLTWVYYFVSIIDILRMLVLHPYGVIVLLKHVADENGTLRCNSVLVLVEKPDCIKKCYLFFFWSYFYWLNLDWSEWWGMMTSDSSVSCPDMKWFCKCARF